MDLDNHFKSFPNMIWYASNNKKIQKKNDKKIASKTSIENTLKTSNNITYWLINKNKVHKIKKIQLMSIEYKKIRYNKVNRSKKILKLQY